CEEMGEAGGASPSGLSPAPGGRRSHSFHVVSCLGTGRKCSVGRIAAAKDSDIWINGGYFVLRRQVLDSLKGGRELVPDVFNALREQDQLVAWRHEGFWASMDTP